MNTDTHTIWHQARTLYAEGKTARQIAHMLNLFPSEISTHALQENWPAPKPPDWDNIRNAWEAGKSDRALALAYGISAATLRKRRVRENWQRGSARGIDALRHAVRILENTLDHADPSDTVVITRLAAALSMAAGRLREAEKQLLEKMQSNTEAGADQDYEGENEAFREHMTDMLMRLAGAEEEEGEEG